MTETVPCPYCGAEEGSLLRHRAPIVQCEICGLIYLKIRLNSQTLHDIYQSYAEEGSHMALPKTIDNIINSGLRRWQFLDEAQGVLGKERKGRWLDVGCGWGALLDEVRERGFSPVGIEITQKCLHFAVFILGLPVSNLDFLQAPLLPNSLTAVSMVHVFEHLTETKRCLEKIKTILEPGGIFCGIVPNFNSVASQIQKDDWSWLDPNFHYVHFTPDVLRAIAEKEGLEVVTLYTASGDFGDDVPMELLAQEKNPELPSDPHDALKKAQELGLGEEIRFIFRKRS